jgi:hypothetical protein
LEANQSTLHSRTYLPLRSNRPESPLLAVVQVVAVVLVAARVAAALAAEALEVGAGLKVLRADCQEAELVDLPLIGSSIHVQSFQTFPSVVLLYLAGRRHEMILLMIPPTQCHILNW